VGLGSGSVYGVLDSFAVGAGGFHGVFDKGFVLEADDEAGFNFAIAAETPSGSIDLLGQNFLDGSDGDEVTEDFRAEGGVVRFYVGRPAQGAFKSVRILFLTLTLRQA